MIALSISVCVLSLLTLVLTYTTFKLSRQIKDLKTINGLQQVSNSVQAFKLSQQPENLVPEKPGTTYRRMPIKP